MNLGPLLYHYSDINGQNSIEPTYEDLIIIMESVGFDILSSRSGIRTKYAQNPLSMKQSEYQSLFWVCRKPPNNYEQPNQRQQRQQQREEEDQRPNNEPPDLIVNQSNENDLDFETEAKQT